MKQQTKSVNASVRACNKLVAGYYEETYARFPESGSAAGKHEYDNALSRPNPRTFEQQSKLAEKTLRAIEDLPRGDFDAAQMLERRAMLSILRSEVVNDIQLRRWQNDPQMHLHGAADALFNLIVRHADNLKPVAGALEARLRAMPAYFDGAAECIASPDPLWQRLTLQAAPGVEQLCMSLPAPLANATGKPVAYFKTLAKSASSAVRGYARKVGKQEPAAAGSFALGHDLFALRLRELTGLDWTPREAATVGRARAAQLSAALKAEACKFGRKSADEIIEAAREAWQPAGGNLMKAYRDTTKGMKARFSEADLLTFPRGEKLLVKAVPEFMRDLIPTAAYGAPGPFDPDQTGIFWVNDPADRKLSSEQTARENRQHFGLELTCAHEAYPGHHVQFIIQNRLPGLARKLDAHAIFYEGWTLWCEEMTAGLLEKERNTPHPYARLQQLHDELWRAWRIVIDVGLHTGDLTAASAAKLLQRELGFTKARATAEINWYTSSPTVPMSYLLGKMEVLRLKAQRVDRGGWSLKKFNDWMLSFGAIPWRWIEESGL